jgi:hypothetical protein
MDSIDDDEGGKTFKEEIAALNPLFVDKSVELSFKFKVLHDNLLKQDESDYHYVTYLGLLRRWLS